ncbi:MAG: hypothetical protein AAFQ40_14790 [Cyanobacteria bacterium J06623_5]
MSLCLLGCTGRPPVRVVTLPDVPVVAEGQRLSGSLSEVAPPGILLDLAALMEQYQPQVAIASPRADKVIDETRLEVKLSLRGLPVYKDEAIGLGPHLQVVLDNQPPQSVYDLANPLVLEGLTPGSHTLRAFAVKPWGESFKNPAAFAQTTFHIFAKTGENTPNPQQPLLTYNEPSSTYGAEPVLLDFYLTNAPLHDIAKESQDDEIADWQIRCTINGQSFTFDQWKPIYIKGLKPGLNWLELSLTDTQGNPIPNAFNSTVHTLTYNPDQRDSLAKLVRGEFLLEQVGRIADPGYEPPAPPAETIPAETVPAETAIPREALPDDTKTNAAETAEPNFEEPDAATSELESTADVKDTPAESMSESSPAQADADQPEIAAPKDTDSENIDSADTATQQFGLDTQRDQPEAEPEQSEPEAPEQDSPELETAKEKRLEPPVVSKSEKSAQETLETPNAELNDEKKIPSSEIAEPAVKITDTVPDADPQTQSLNDAKQPASEQPAPEPSAAEQRSKPSEPLSDSSARQKSSPWQSIRDRIQSYWQQRSQPAPSPPFTNPTAGTIEEADLPIIIETQTESPEQQLPPPEQPPLKNRSETAPPSTTEATSPEIEITDIPTTLTAPEPATGDVLLGPKPTQTFPAEDLQDQRQPQNSQPE